MIGYLFIATVPAALIFLAVGEVFRCRECGMECLAWSRRQFNRQLVGHEQVHTVHDEIVGLLRVGRLTATDLGAAVTHPEAVGHVLSLMIRNGRVARDWVAQPDQGAALEVYRLLPMGVAA